MKRLGRIRSLLYLNSFGKRPEETRIISLTKHCAEY
ncbi:unnamed protein product [Schistosoma margrebowiei]|uniref:Uncharacterized protein n=1 Tax=Schistosoma margrebowiei TaxID=48269 RepID=A0A3P7Z248_9TREM|nr:unnamed protein product [Schistosoma margrebowiei]